MSELRLSALICGSLLALTSAISAAAEPEPSKPASHTVRQIEGWTVRVDGRLLKAPHEALGSRALKLLEAKLVEIKGVVVADRLAKLQAVPIVLDLTHGKLRSMQYHPSPEWLVSHGYARDLAKCAHVPEAADFVNPRHNNEQPWAMLHELAHAYHDQVLDFDEPRIRKAWERYKESGRGNATLHVNGGRTRHYALTDQKEFFAEMSEAYFGINDFFPFNRAELKTAEPEIFELIQTIWGGIFEAAKPKPAKAARQFGGERLDFMVEGSQGFVLLPTRPAADGSKPWVWYAPTLTGSLPDPSHEWLFSRLLAQGFTMAGVDVGESFGNPQGRAVYTRFYRFVTEKYGLASKVCLLAQSRGGLMLYNWAAEHPDWVECIGGIYPVCDQASWPGLATSCRAYGLTEAQLREQLAKHNPIDRLAPLAAAKVPILHVHGNVDTVVPLERNSAELARRYRAPGGKIDVVVVEGKGHQVCPEFFESKRLLDFLLARGKAGIGNP